MPRCPKGRFKVAETLSNSVMPYLTYDDPNAALEWLKKAFGVEEIALTTGPQGEIVHAELKIGTGIILLTGANGNGVLPMGSPRSLPHSHQGVFVRIDGAKNVDKHHDQAVSAGAKVLMPLQDMPWGSREYTCQDVEGHIWSFGTYNPGRS